MIEETKKTNRKTVQKILRRVIEINTSSCIISGVGITSFDNWRDFLVFDNRAFCLKDLLEEGWRVVSITQSFAPYGSKYVFGVDTVIIEKEIDE